MNKYFVTYMVPGTIGHANRIEDEEVEAVSYSTQATSGAGLVADFYFSETPLVKQATFSQVTSIRKAALAEFDSHEAALAAGHEKAAYGITYRVPPSTGGGGGGMGEINWTHGGPAER